MIQNTVQFGESALDDPNSHIADFLEICDTFKFNGVSDDAVRLRLFPFSLRDKAKSWLNCLPVGSITTWEDMAKAFLIKYFPPSKTMKLRADITTFAQYEQESLYQAWERYKDLLRRYAAACGNLLRKTAEEGYELLEEMATSSYHPQSDRQRRGAGVNQVNDLSAVSAQLEALNRKIDGMSMSGSAMRLQEIFCDKCGEMTLIRTHIIRDGGITQTFHGRGQNNQNRQQRGPPYGMHQGFKPEPPREERSNLEQMMTKFISATETRFQNQDASIKGLENQIGQLAKLIANREQGALPSNTETKPREHVKAVELRSGKALESNEEKTKHGEDEVENRGAMKKAKLDAQFDILANKRKLEDHMTVNLTENCSALVQNKMPPKQKDPGSFSITCIIGDINFHKALCDLGESINLMPFSVFRRLGLGEPKPTKMSLQLADRSVKYPRGIIEDVLVKVDKFIFPADFVILDMEEDLEMPLILGRPVLATGKALIDVEEGKLRLRVGEEEIIFDVFNTLKHTMHNDSCFRIDVLDSLVCDFMQDGLKEPLEATLTTEKQEDELDEEKMEMVAHLNAIPPWRKQVRLRLEELRDRKDLMPQKSSLEEPPTLELKPLPPHLKYVYLGENNKLPVIISSSLTDDMESKLLGVLKEHKGAFAWKVSDIKGISPSICMHKILMEDKYSPLAQPQRRLNPKMQEVVKAETIKLLDAGIIYPISDSAWVSPVQCVPKKGGITVITNEKNDLIPTRTVTGWRVCIDYRKLNDATRKDHFPLPFIDQMIERLAGHEFYCFLDGYSGYNQITIAPEDQEKTTFTCPYGTFAFRRMPFGLCNAPATFQRCMTAIFHDMTENFLEIFMDDFSIFGSSFNECLENLNLVLVRCEESNLVLNEEKCHFMVQEGIVLGHKVSENGIEVDKAKVEVIKNLPPPSSIKGVRSFLGHAGFYRRFIKDFSKIAKILSSLLMKDAEFNFDSTCLHAFEILKESLVTAPLLTVPDWELPFEVMCDASDTAVGAVLGQRKNKVFHTIYYASKTLNDAQLNYATTEKELLAIVFAFDKFHSYLVLSKVTVYTDHSALKYLLAKKDAKPRLIRWILLLQEFDLEIRDKKGVENVVADHLSRLEHVRIKGSDDDIDDWFPDEQLLEVNAYPWYADFANFLVTGTPPPNLLFHQRKKFFSDVKYYFWEEPFLFKICAHSMIRRCVAEEETNQILNHCHDREVGGHFGPIRTASKVLECGFY
ncbi:LOW QUALITY PROTEIN: uncharacterized protein LOC142514366 [Primulina tabacum]|uniref:LOW QUALITY PROTEIN: uncharacterized protein LOC142514366 n=1 Tax=Primulina tabacum TaxID=48773 RepID=UPI003F5909E2